MVSLGPGDADLVTLKALKALKSSNAICVPTKSYNNSFEKSLTYSIVSQLMREYSFSKPLIAVYAPMQYQFKDWQNQVEIICKALEEHKVVSFVTLGDSGIYSSVYYLLEIIKAKNPKLYYESEVIAGVTSFSEASARVKKPLCIGDSRLEITPLVDDRKLPKTTIYMRPKVGMSTDDIKESGEIYTFENLGYDNESVFLDKKPKVSKYMTLFIDFFK
jgi:precorrin-2/cobalt-factor-2 C20-methyltransferase